MNGWKKIFLVAPYHDGKKGLYAYIAYFGFIFTIDVFMSLNVFTGNNFQNP